MSNVPRSVVTSAPSRKIPQPPASGAQLAPTPAQARYLDEVRDLLGHAQAVKKKAERAAYIRPGSREAKLILFLEWVLMSALWIYEQSTEKGWDLTYDKPAFPGADDLAVTPFLRMVPPCVTGPVRGRLANVIEVDFRSRGRR